MLPKSYRISAKDLDPLKKTGHKLNSQHLTLLSLPNQLGHFRATTIISKKISPKAVNRNQLNRHLLASLKETSPSAFDILIIPKPSALTLSYRQIVTELSSAISRLPPHSTGHGLAQRG